jgi:hypothetical protein
LFPIYDCWSSSPRAFGSQQGGVSVYLSPWLEHSSDSPAAPSSKFLAAFFDGVCGSVVGVIAIVAIDILGASVGFTGHTAPTTFQEAMLVAAQDAISAVIYIVTLAVLYRFTHKYTAIILVLCGALGGQFLFV